MWHIEYVDKLSNLSIYTAILYQILLTKNAVECN